MEYIAPLLFATVVSADYYIDNANTSVVYAMSASGSAQAWQKFSVSTKSLALSFSNSTGNYTIELDATHCYDQNYALGVCGTNDNCSVEMPFTGSGITMYVFNAGSSGMTASFSVDGNTAVTNSIQAPSAALNYQVSNVSLYDIQGLPTGNHTMKMTVLDWNGAATSMKFDYARVNETLVTSPTTTTTTTTSQTITTSTSGTSSRTPSRTPTQTPTGNTAAASSKSSSNANIGGIIGATLGGLAVCAIIVIGVLYYLRRRRKTKPQADLTPESTFQVHPFPSDYGGPTLPSGPRASAHQRSFSSLRQESASRVRCTLRDALSAGSLSSTPQRSQSTQSLQSSAVARSAPHGQPSYRADVDVRPPTGAPLSDPEMASRYNLTAPQVDVVERLRRTNVPLDTVARVIEGFVASNLAERDRLNDKLALTRERSVESVAPPPSYQS